MPVAGDPCPGVLGHVAVDEQALLEGVQEVEDRLVGSLARRHLDEDRRPGVQPGHPSGLMHAGRRVTVDDDDRGGAGVGRGQAIEGGQKVIAPRHWA